MKILTAIIAIFLILGLFGVPNGVFAQDTSSTGSSSTLQHSNSGVLDNMVPLLKGGGRGGGFSSSKSSSKKIHSGDDDTDDNSTDDGSSGFSWITVIIILVVLFGIIGFLVWFFVLRK